MDKLIKELNVIRSCISRQTYKTILGQIRAGDIKGAAVGVERLKIKQEREEANNENCCSK